MEWRIGCSGFSYKEWKNIFYPEGLPQKRWFDYYSSKFDTLELNVTFYRFPNLSLFQGWYEKSPERFRFSVKAPRLITHLKQLRNVKEQLTDFYTTCADGLKDKLGPILFQFPPTFFYTEERLELILDTLDTSFTNVVELRHAGWWNKQVFDELAKRSIIFCGISYPDLPDEVIDTGPTIYYRFHGTPKLYYSEYDNATLSHFADKVSILKKVKKVYCYFNNTAAVGAIDNALWLEEYVARILSP